MGIVASVIGELEPVPSQQPRAARAVVRSGGGRPLRGNAAGDAPRVLVVDDDRGIQETFGRALHLSGFEVATAGDARTALDAARAGFDVMLLDVHLGLDNGLDVLRTLRSEGVSGEVVVITGFDTEGIESEARRLGAAFVDRWTLPDPVDLVVRALSNTPARRDPDAKPPIMPPVLTRWAEAVAAGLESPDDPTSVAIWAHAIGKSDCALRTLCDLTKISAKNSCSLVRVLRAVHLARVSGRIDPSEWLFMGDERTLGRLLADGGVEKGKPASLEEVLRRQRLVAHHAAIGILSRVLRERGFFGFADA